MATERLTGREIYRVTIGQLVGQIERQIDKRKRHIKTERRMHRQRERLIKTGG